MSKIPRYDLTFIHAIEPLTISKAFTYEDNQLKRSKDGGALRVGYLEVQEGMSRREYAEYARAAGFETSRVIGSPIDGIAAALVLEESVRKDPMRRQALYRDYDLPEDFPCMSRTRHFFEFSDRPTLWALDYDPHGDVVLSFEELLDIYCSALPELRGQFCLQFHSSSSFMRCTSTKEMLIAEAGKRTIFAVNRGAHIPRLTDILYKRLWLKGYGFYTVTKKGALSHRTLIDVNMKQPERLDFVGGVRCEGDIEQIRLPYRFINEDAPDIDVDTIADLSPEEEEEYHRLLANEKTNPKYIQLIADAKRIDTQNYIRKQQIRGENSTPDEIAAYEHRREVRLRTGVLHRDETVLTRFGPVSVREILSNPRLYHGCDCADPDDDDILGKAKIYLDRQPCIFSFSHGEHVILLDPDLAEEIRQEKRDDIRQRLKERLNRTPKFASPKLRPFSSDSVLPVEVLAENCKRVTFPEPPKIPVQYGARLNLTEAEEEVRRFLRDAHGNRLLRAEAGVGKTREIIRQAKLESEEELVIVAMRSHKLKKEAVSNFPDEHQTIIDVYGRTTCGPAGHHAPKLCYNATRAKLYEQMGYKLGRTLCLFCEYRDRCAYREQASILKRFKEARKGLIFCSHRISAHLARDLGAMNIFFDESPLSSLIYPEPSLTVDDVQTLIPCMKEDGREVVRRLRVLTDELLAYMRASKKMNARFYSTESTVNQWRWSHTIWEAIGISKSEAHCALIETLDELEDPHQSHLRLFEAGVNRNAFLWLRDAICDGYAWLDFDLRQKPPVTLKRLVKERFPEECRITIADATIDLDEARSLFSADFEACDARVSWESHLVWIKQAMGVTKTRAMNDKDRIECLKTAIEYLPNQCRKTLLATYKHHEKDCLEIARDLRPDLTWLSGHFGDFRSSNKYEECDSIILFGSLILPPLGLVDTASLLFPNNPEKQLAWWHHKSLEEQYQTVHRLRLVRNPGRTVIIVSNHYATHLLGSPDVVVEISSGNGKRGAALLRALAAIDLTGKFTKDDAVRCGIGQEKDASLIAEAYCGDDGLILFDDSNTHWWSNLLRDICTRRPHVELIGAQNMGHGRGRTSAYVLSSMST